MTDTAAQASESFMKAAQVPTEAFAGLQKDIIESYEEASRAWLERVRTEVDLWSQFTGKLAGIRSPSDAVGIYREWFGEHMKMAADDGRRLTDHWQHFVEKLTHSLGNGRPAAST
jgi:hypothetical protein